jgi:hypothetical protein
MESMKNCKACGGEFEKQSNRQLYCPSCGRRGKADCSVCGTEFKRKGNDSGLYCSRECFHKATGNPARSRRLCDVCGREYKPKVENGKTCSRECAGEAQRRDAKVCPVCQSEYRTPGNTCSYDCAGVLRRANPQPPCERCGAPLPWRGTRPVRYCSAECRATPLGTVRGPNINGYLEVRTGQGFKGWTLQHRYVMEQSIGRKLEPHETVHHKNGDRRDNRLENLELWHGKHGKGVRSADYHCAGCRCAVVESTP